MSTTHQALESDMIGRVLGRVADEFKGTIDAPVWSLDDQGLDARFAQVMAVRAAVDELAARLVGEMDDRDHAIRLGGSSTKAHLIGTHRLSRGEAARMVTAARQLHGSSTLTEPVRRAQACGAVSQEQATTIAVAINEISPEIPDVQVEAAQSDLIRFAGELPVDDLQRLANHVLEVVDPDRADALLEQKLRREERVALASCELTLKVKPDGSSDGWFKSLPALQTAMFKKAIDAYATPRRDHLHSEITAESAQIEPLDRRLETSARSCPTRTGWGARSASSSSTSRPTGFRRRAPRTRRSWSRSMRRSCGEVWASPRSTRAPRSRRARPVGWRAMPGSCRWCSPGTRRSSIWAGGSGCSTAINALPWRTATEVASSRAATGRRPGAKPTT